MYLSDQAWRERDAALLRDQMSQTQMYSMREKLESVESAVKNVNKNTRDELEFICIFSLVLKFISFHSRHVTTFYN